MKRFLKFFSVIVLSLVIGLSVNTDVFAASPNYDVTILLLTIYIPTFCLLLMKTAVSMAVTPD
ncbi:MAG: hypothetical protein J6C04_09210 [Oscillospiraceae bacterium]|nr:hypothetical protein [Oscillospiraceae bacterium]